MTLVYDEVAGCQVACAQFVGLDYVIDGAEEVRRLLYRQLGVGVGLGELVIVV